jgi:hypothetical protein
MKTRILAATLIAALSMALMPTIADAQRVGNTYVGRGYAGTPPPPPPGSGWHRGGPPPQGGGYRGGVPVAGGTWSGGWRAPPPAAWGRPWGPAWRPGWGWGGWGWGGWGWGGWGWGVGWSPGWWGPGFWGWSVGAPVVITPSVSGAWVLPPSASTVFIERETEVAPAAAPSPQLWWYWCESSRAYYPYVETCAEGWRRVEPRTPPGAQ